MTFKQTLPNALTLGRIVLIPVICWLVFISGPTAAWSAFALYAVAAISDFFDGYLARKWNVPSVFGRVFDPIADKLLVAALLVCLAASGRIGGLELVPAILIILRELLVSGLREYLAPLRISLPVSRLAKWKTTVQLLALAGFLLLPVRPLITPSIVLLWLAAALTLVTGWQYLRATLRTKPL
jgi:CDP-diacylglycerol--glycerol-3-phosphate 3-phosphatidyltransferase